MTENLNLGMGYMLLPFFSWNPTLTAWTPLTLQFRLVCDICSTTAIIMKSGS